ncbi:MAG: hypothetical protein ACM30I_08900 [Gemmatimonas sp.]
MAHRILVNERAVRTSDWYARKSLLTRDMYAASQSTGTVTISGLLIRIAITSVLVAAMLIATNSLMLHWLH